MIVTVELSAAPERSVTIPMTGRSVDYWPTFRDEQDAFSATQDTVDDDGERRALGFGTHGGERGSRRRCVSRTMTTRR